MMEGLCSDEGWTLRHLDACYGHDQTLLVAELNSVMHHAVPDGDMV